MTGPVTIIDVEGREISVPADGAVALCRCGESQTKPFCDGSHKGSGFSSCVRA